MIRNSCLDDFKQKLIPSHNWTMDDLKSLVIQMYSKCNTTSEIYEMLEQIVWCSLTPQSISNMTHVVQDQVIAFHYIFTNDHSMKPLRWFTAIQPIIYTTNLIENLYKQIKRDMKRKEQFSNEEAMDHFTCVKVLDNNQNFYERIHKGFNLVTAELIILFESEVE